MWCLVSAPAHQSDSGNNRAATVQNIFDEALEGIQIIPLLGANLETLARKKRYRGIFHHISFSQQALDALQEGVLDHILAPNGSVSVETCKYIFPLSSKDIRDQATKKLQDICTAQNLREVDIPPESNIGCDNGAIESDLLLFCRKK